MVADASAGMSEEKRRTREKKTDAKKSPMPLPGNSTLCFCLPKCKVKAVIELHSRSFDDPGKEIVSCLGGLLDGLLVHGAGHFLANLVAADHDGTCGCDLHGTCSPALE